jgi:hypothetical protein
MVSREAAAQIAEAYARSHDLGFKVAQTSLLHEIHGRSPMCYGLSDADLARCWIAYIDDPDPWCLRSSTIVVIDPDDGSVVYAGSAADEG